MLFDGVFKGGGALGTPYLGALAFLQRNGCWFKRVAGNSAGSIIGGLIAAGYKPVNEGRQDPANPLHTRSLQDLLFNVDSFRIPVCNPSAVELKAMIPRSLANIYLHAAVKFAADKLIPPLTADPQIKVVFPVGAVPPPFTPMNSHFDPPPGTVWRDMPFTAPPPDGSTYVVAVAMPPPLAGLGSPSSGPPLLPGWTFAVCKVSDIVSWYVTQELEGQLSLAMQALVDLNPLLDFVVAKIYFRELFFGLEAFGRYRSDRLNRWYNDTVVAGLVTHFPDSGFPVLNGMNSSVHDGDDTTNVAPPSTLLRNLTAEQRQRWRPTMLQARMVSQISFSCITAAVRTREMIVMNDEETPGLAVADAVTMSASAPFAVFKPFPFPGEKDMNEPEWSARFNAKGRPYLFRRSDLCVDGGIVGNYPLWIFSPPASGFTPYVTPESRPILGFSLDSREPGTPYLPGSPFMDVNGDIQLAGPDGKPADAAHGLPVLPVLAYQDDVNSPWPAAPVALHAMGIVETAMGNLDNQILHGAEPRPAHRLTVFLPSAPFDWLRFDATDQERAELAVRGWISTRNTLHAAGWPVTTTVNEPEFFARSLRTNETTPEGPTITDLGGQDALLGWRSNDPSNSVFFANISEEWQPPRLVIDDPNDIQAPTQSTRLMTLTRGQAFDNVATRFGPCFVTTKDGLYGFVLSPTDITPGSSIQTFATKLDEQKHPVRPISRGPLNVSGTATDRRSNLPLTVVAVDGRTALAAWVAVDGNVRLGRFSLPADGAPMLLSVVSVTVAGVPLATTQAVALAPTENPDVVILAFNSRGTLQTGTLGGVSGRVELVDTLGPMREAPFLAAARFGSAPLRSRQSVDGHAVQNWLTDGFLVTWISAANSNDEIHFALLDPIGKSVLRSLKPLIEDTDIHNTHSRPAVAGARTVTRTKFVNETGKEIIADDEIRLRTNPVSEVVGASNAYFAWQARDDGNRIYIAKMLGLTATEDYPLIP